MRRMPAVVTASLLVLAALPCPAGGGELDGEIVYQQSIDAVLWILSTKDKGKTYTSGTGVIIDAQRGYALTAYHVIDGQKDDVLAISPARDAEGEIVSNGRHYWNNLSSLAVPCEVVDTDSKRDLALLKLRSVPATAKALPIALKRAKPGQRLLTIGMTGTTAPPVDTLWQCGVGVARQVLGESYKFDSGQVIQATILENMLPINAGNSGGPVINAYGELVGINSATSPKLNQVQKAIDVSEIWVFVRKPDRPINLTLLDRVRSDLVSPVKRLCLITLCAKGNEWGETVRSVSLTVGTDGRVTALPTAVYTLLSRLGLGNQP